MNYTDDMKHRLKRVEGQVRGILRMMEEGSHCKDVVSQLSAVRSAVDKTVAHIVAANLEHCIMEQHNAGEHTGKIVKEAIDLLVKSR